MEMKLVKMKIKNHILILLILIIVGCATEKSQLLPTNNKGGYLINYIQNRSKVKSDFVFVSGKILDVKTKKPLSDVKLVLGCYKTTSSDNGEFSFKISAIPSAIPTFIETNSIGYKTILTDSINTSNMKEIVINFYLEEDSRPLGDCLGTIIQKQID